MIDLLVACGGGEHDHARSCFRRLASLAGEAAAALAAGDLDAWAAALTAATDTQADLHAGLVGAAHRRAIDVARAHGALGWKVNGAGGRGRLAHRARARRGRGGRAAIGAGGRRRGVGRARPPPDGDGRPARPPLLIPATVACSARCVTSSDGSRHEWRAIRRIGFAKRASRWGRSDGLAAPGGTSAMLAAMTIATLDELGGWPAVLGKLTGGGDLTGTEASAAMAEILDGNATSAQIAGFIVALRMKGETVDELTGLVAGDDRQGDAGPARRSRRR